MLTITIQLSFPRLLSVAAGVEVPREMNSRYMSSWRDIQSLVANQFVRGELLVVESGIDTALVVANSFAVFEEVGFAGYSEVETVAAEPAQAVEENRTEIFQATVPMQRSSVLVSEILGIVE